jgi:hypothetical protein
VAADAVVTTVRGERSKTKAVVAARAMVRRSRMQGRMRAGCGHGGGEESSGGARQVARGSDLN